MKGWVDESVVSVLVVMCLCGLCVCLFGWRFGGCDCGCVYSLFRVND